MGMDSSIASLQSSDKDPDFFLGHCCATLDGSTECPDSFACVPGDAFCATGSRDDGTGNYISNRFLQEFMYPSNADNCPA